MTKIEARCEHALHFKYDPERDEIEIKCRECSRALRQPVYHRWPRSDIMAQFEQGEAGGVCTPAPTFVHWRVVVG